MKTISATAQQLRRRGDLILMLDVDVPWINPKVQPQASAQVIQIDIDPLKTGLGVLALPGETRLPGGHTGHAETQLAAVGEQSSGR
jgi:thiamine pyrophosphate-dependent acetolactate synthase large subunit-like protein